MTGASFDALTGQIDFLSPGKPSDPVPGPRLGSIKRAVKRAVLGGLRRLID